MRMKLFAAAAISGAALLLSATGASAYTVCNDRGDCWRSTVRYEDPSVHLVFYDDNYDWRGHHYRFHEVSDVPGYWDPNTNAYVTIKKTTTTTTTSESTEPH